MTETTKFLGKLLSLLKRMHRIVVAIQPWGILLAALARLKWLHKQVVAIQPWSIFIAAFALGFTVVEFLINYEDRVRERTVHAWTIITNPASGISGKIEALEYLNEEDGLFCRWFWEGCFVVLKQRVPLVGINLSASSPQNGNSYTFTFLQKINLSRAILSESDISYADLRHAILSEAHLSGTNFHGARLDGATFRNAHLPRAVLVRANLSGADFREACIDTANLSEADMRLANFNKATLRRANLRDANLIDAKFHYAALDEANFSGANLTGADFSGTSGLLSGPTIECVDFIVPIRTITFSARRRAASLVEAKFRDAILHNANFSGANLTGADFSGARGLLQDQLDKACADRDRPPVLPNELVWKGDYCH